MPDRKRYDPSTPGGSDILRLEATLGERGFSQANQREITTRLMSEGADLSSGHEGIADREVDRFITQRTGASTFHHITEAAPPYNPWKDQNYMAERQWNDKHHSQPEHAPIETMQTRASALNQRQYDLDLWAETISGARTMEQTRKLNEPFVPKETEAREMKP